MTNIKYYFDYLHKILKPNSEDEKVLLSKSSSTFGLNILGLVFTFIIHILLTNILDQSEYGKFTYILSILMVLGAISKFGFDTSSLRFIPQYITQNKDDKLKQFLNFSEIFVISFGIVVAITFYFVYNGWYNFSIEIENILLIGLLWLPFRLYIEIKSIHLRGFQKIVESLLPFQLLIPALTICVLVTIYIFNKPLVDAKDIFWVWIFVYTIVVVLIVMLKYFRIDYRRIWKMQKYRMWIQTSFPMMLLAIFTILQTRSSEIILGTISTYESVSIFSVASRISAFAAFGLIALNQILAPTISKIYFSKNVESLNSILRFAVRINTLFTSFITVLLLVFSNFIFSLFGDEYSSANNILVILLFGQIVNALSGSVGYTLNMIGKQNIVSLVVGLSTALNIFLCLILVPKYYEKGAAIAQVVSIIFWNITLVTYSRYKLKIKTSIL